MRSFLWAMFTTTLIAAPAPTVTSITSSYSPEAGGTVHIITGTGFVLGANVYIGGALAASTVNYPTAITVSSAPAGTFGVANVLVVNPDTQDSGATGNGLFYYYKKSDFNALTAGSMSAAALIAATGVSSFARAETTNVSSQATCQTSASTLESGVVLNAARIDDNGTVKGLLIEQRMANMVPYGGARKINIGWTASVQGTQTNNVATGPDGQANKASQCNMGTTSNISNYAALAGADTANRYTFSSWQRSVSSGTNGDMCPSIMAAANVVGASAPTTGSNTWQRLVVSKGTTPMQYVFPVDTYDMSAGAGGQTARARNLYVDFMQIEPGDWPSSAINTDGAIGAVVARPSDYLGLTLPTVGNRIRMYMRLYPNFATSTSIQSTNAATDAIYSPTKSYLYYIDANNYMYMKDSDKKLYCKVNGSTEEVSTNALSFTYAEDLEFLIEVGNNTATVLKYRINAGSWTDLVMSTFSGNATPAGDASICNDTVVANADGQAFPCRLREIRVYPADVTTAEL